MRKLLVFQHVAHEILGTLNPLLKRHRFRVRYINFQRHPEIEPAVEKYNGLVVLGGYIGVYEADRYKHVKYEIRAIEKALAMNIPVLGICFGAQLLAHVLGANVRKHTEKEMGWCDLQVTSEGSADALLGHFEPTEKIFQMHGDTFDIPKGAVHLARSEACEGQAFRFGDRAYGLQFHLEVDKAMIHRWLKVPQNLADLQDGGYSIEKITNETETHIARAVELSRKTFAEFIQLFGLKEPAELIGSGHGKSSRWD